MALTNPQTRALIAVSRSDTQTDDSFGKIGTDDIEAAYDAIDDYYTSTFQAGILAAVQASRTPGMVAAGGTWNMRRLKPLLAAYFGWKL